MPSCLKQLGGAIYAIDIHPPDLRYGTSSTGFLESIPISLSIMPSYALYVPYVPYVSYVPYVPYVPYVSYVSYVLFFYAITSLCHFL